MSKKLYIVIRLVYKAINYYNFPSKRAIMLEINNHQAVERLPLNQPNSLPITRWILFGHSRAVVSWKNFVNSPHLKKDVIQLIFIGILPLLIAIGLVVDLVGCMDPPDKDQPDDAEPAPPQLNYQPPASFSAILQPSPLSQLDSKAKIPESILPQAQESPVPKVVPSPCPIQDHRSWSLHTGRPQGEATVGVIAGLVGKTHRDKLKKPETWQMTDYVSQAILDQFQKLIFSPRVYLPLPAITNILQQFKNVTDLEFTANCKLTDDKIEQILALCADRLERLVMIDAEEPSAITDKLAPVLAKCTNLKELHLPEECALTPQVVRQIVQQCPKLEKILPPGHSSDEPMDVSAFLQQHL